LQAWEKKGEKVREGQVSLFLPFTLPGKEKGVCKKRTASAPRLRRGYTCSKKEGACVVRRRGGKKKLESGRGGKRLGVRLL